VARHPFKVTKLGTTLLNHENRKVQIFNRFESFSKHGELIRALLLLANKPEAGSFRVPYHFFQSPYFRERSVPGIRIALQEL
jgi:hypothetical protein